MKNWEKSANISWNVFRNWFWLIWTQPKNFLTGRVLSLTLLKPAWTQNVTTRSSHILLSYICLICWRFVYSWWSHAHKSQGPTWNRQLGWGGTWLWRKRSSLNPPPPSVRTSVSTTLLGAMDRSWYVEDSLRKSRSWNTCGNVLNNFIFCIVL